jgi:hypothetical protein
VTEDPRGLLVELAAMRKRARADRHGYWLHPTGKMMGPVIAYREPGIAVDLYWLVALLCGYLAVVRWYRWRAAQVGVETPISLYAQVTIFLLVRGRAVREHRPARGRAPGRGDHRIRATGDGRMSENPTAGLDDTVHQRHRLGVLTIAAETKRVEFSAPHTPNWPGTD